MTDDTTMTHHLFVAAYTLQEVTPSHSQLTRVAVGSMREVPLPNTSRTPSVQPKAPTDVLPFWNAW